MFSADDYDASLNPFADDDDDDDGGGSDVESSGTEPSSTEPSSTEPCTNRDTITEENTSKVTRHCFFRFCQTKYTCKLTAFLPVPLQHLVVHFEDLHRVMASGTNIFRSSRIVSVQ